MKNSLLKITTFGLSILLLLAGCQQQSLNDQLGKKLVENAIENAGGGKVKVDLNNLDSSSGNFNIKSEDGTAIMGSGNTRPESIPSDLPNIDGAKDFSWFGSPDGGMFAYTVASSDYKAVCGKQLDLLTSAGWTKSDAYSMDAENFMTRAFEKSGFELSMTCSVDDKGATSILMTKSKK